MVKKVLLFLLVAPFLLFIIGNFNLVLIEWSKVPSYLSSGIESLFSIDKIRYSVELNGDFVLTRFFYNKVSYLVGIVFKSLSVTSPKNIFIGGDFQLIPVFFLPLWFVGIYKLIKGRKFWWFVVFLIVSVFIYLTGQTSSYILMFIIPFYFYAIWISFK